MSHPQNTTWRPDPPKGDRDEGREATGPDGQGGQRTDAPREKRDVSDDQDQDRAG